MRVAVPQGRQTRAEKSGRESQLVAADRLGRPGALIQVRGRRI